MADPTPSDSPNSPNALSYDAIIASSLENKIKISPPSNGIATEETVEIVCKEILAELKLTQSDTNVNKTKLTIATLAQEGATSPRFTESRTCSLFGINLSVALLRKSSKKHSTTVRALARALRSEAIKVATAFEIEGNLSKSYKLQFPSAQKTDLYWVSDFQSFSSDPAMPDNIRTWLLENYSNRFAPKKTN